MRDIKTLLQIVIDSLKEGEKKHYWNFGICGEIADIKNDGIIDNEERLKIINTLFENKPSVSNKFKSFLLCDYWIGSKYWWITMDRYPNTRKIRIDYLTQLKNSL